MRTTPGSALVAGVLLAAAACGGTHPTTGRSTSAPPPAVTTTTTSATPTVTATTTPSVVGPSGGSVPSGFEPGSVTFVSADEGFVLGTTSSCSSPPCTSLLRTTDGGDHWVGIPAPRATYGTDVSGLVFADARDGFAYDDQLWATHDGGASWHRIDAPAGVTPDGIDSLVATGGAVFASLRTNGQSGEIVRASAGSDTFTRVVGSLPSAVYGLTAAGDDVLAVEGVTPSGDTPGRITLLTGGGAVVRTVSSPSAGEDPCSVGTSSATAWLAVCGSFGAGATTGTRTAYGTTDGGQHWTRLPDPPEGGGYGTDGVAVTTGEHAAIGTSSGVSAGILTTTDGGAHWTTTLSFHDGHGESVTPGFTTASRGVAIYSPPYPNDPGHAAARLYRTTDGGVHWTPVTF